MKKHYFYPVSLASTLYFVLLDDLAQTVDADDDREALRLLSGVVGYIDGFYEGSSRAV